MSRLDPTDDRARRAGSFVLLSLLIGWTLLLLPAQAWSHESLDDDDRAVSTAAADLTPGVVAMWAGPLAEIPGGWAQDPEYVDRFIRGAAAAVEPGQRGGGAHDHLISMDGCSTGANTFARTAELQVGTHPTFWQHRHSVDFGDVTTSATSGLPAHMRLAFIVSDTLDLVPPGLIALWSHSLATIPAGWASCNGDGGRPDLSNRFVRGAGAEEEPGTSVASSLSHSHDVPELNAWTAGATGSEPFALVSPI